MQASTPINCDVLESELHTHPDKEFVNLLCSSVRHGFDMMIAGTNVSTFECKNALSARKDPESASALIKDELEKGFIQGPFETPPLFKLQGESYRNCCP